MPGAASRGLLPGPGRALWVAALIALVFGLVAARYVPGDGFTALIQFEPGFADRALPALRATPHHLRASGYDGQFYAQVALDPGLRDPKALQRALDAPAYRARRILLPALAWVLGGGETARVLNIYALLNPLFWLGFLVLLLRACRPLTLPAMLCVTVLALAGGTLESIRLALTDLPATVLLLAAALLALRGSPLWGGVLGALAGLARDTAAAGAGLVLLPISPGQGQASGKKPGPLRRAGSLALAVVPVIAWAFWVGHVFPGSIGQDRGAQDNFGFPLAAAWGRLLTAWHLLQAGSPPWGQEGFAFAAIAGLHLQALYLLLQPRPRAVLWRMGLPFALLLWFLGPAVWNSYLAAARALLPMTVAFNLLLLQDLRPAPSGWKPWAWFAAGNFFSVFGIIKFWTYTA